MALRCGVVGLGRGRVFVEKLSEIGGCEVVAVCDSAEARLADYSGLSTFTSYEELIERAELDVVCVITPGPEHAQQSLLALQAGAHVISETPCVYSLEEARQIVEASDQAGLRFMLAEDYIWMGWTETLKGLADAGKLGEIVHAEAEYTHDCRGGMLQDAEGRSYPLSAAGTRDDLRPTWRASDLPPLFYCSHTLGPLLHLMDDRCTVAIGLHTGAHGAPGICPVDMESGVLRTAGGRVIRLTNGFCIAHPFAFFVGLYGTRGSVRISHFGQVQAKAWLEDEDAGGGWRELPLPWSEREDGRDWLSVMLEEFVAAIRGEREPPIDARRSMDYTLPGICAHLSAEQGGEPIAIPDL